MAVVLVTGGLGFIGRRVCDRLTAIGHDVRVIDSLEPRVHCGQCGKPCIDGTHGGKHVGDVGYTDLLGVDTVVHLAAQVGVADSQTDWFRYLRQNTMETAQLLSVMAQQSVRPTRLVVASSMSVYGDPHTQEPVDERHPVEPVSVYGLTKYDQERLCRIWGEQHRVSTVALRLFNVYGPGQALTNPYTGVLANFASRLLADLPPIVYEDGQQTRDFIYVDDVVERIVAQALGAGASGTYNVCTGEATTVLDAARKLAAALGCNHQPLVTGTTRSGDIRHCVGDPTRYNQTFFPTPCVPFSIGLQRYAESLLSG